MPNKVSHQRSKKGCSTCRQRRIKCDETHPQCLRCLKSQFSCSYTAVVPKVNGTSRPVNTGSRSQRVLLPKRDDILSLTIDRPTQILPGETDIENQYLRYFQEETTSSFQGAWDWSLWNRLMLQGCHSEAFIRDAVVAIGALHKSLRTSAAGQYAPDPASQDLAVLQRQFAFQKYGKALKAIQEAIDTGAGPRVAMIACLLIVCFESHSGDRYKAVTHAQHGWRIYQEQKHHRKDVEDDLVDAFRNLDISIASVADRRAVEWHQKLLDEDASIAATMPPVFKYIYQAKEYWHIVMRRICHFVPTTWKHTETSMFVREFKTKIPGGVVTTVGENVHSASFVVPDIIRDQQSILYAELCHWIEAFEPLLLRTRQSTQSSLREWATVTMLKIQALNAKVQLASIIYDSEMFYDDHLTDFQDIIRLANNVIKIRDSGTNINYFSGLFTLDLGLVVPMFTLLLKCRDRMVRAEALKILAKWHVEGWWDPLLIIGVARAVIDFEEEGMIDGKIPEEHRAILTGKCHAPQERRLLIQLAQRKKDGLKWVERWAKW